MKTISLAWLNEHGACTKSRIWFEETYGNNDVELTKEGLDTVPVQPWLGWLAQEINPKAFDRAGEVYRIAIRPASAAYHSTIARLRNGRADDLAEAAYRDATAQVWAAYLETIKDIILTS